MADGVFVRIAENMPIDLNRIILSLVFDTRDCPVVMSSGEPPSLIQVLSLSKKLAKAANYPPFEDMSPGPELLRLIRECDFMKERFPLIIALNSRMYPESLPSILFTVEKVLCDPDSGTEEEKQNYVSRMVQHLAGKDLFKELSYLIKIVPDNLVHSQELVKCKDFTSIVYKLARTSPKCAFKMVCNWRLPITQLVLLLAPISNEMFYSVQPNLTDSLLSNPHVDVVLDSMICIASSDTFDVYFPKGNLLVYQRFIDLITHLEAMCRPTSFDRVKVSLVRILYAIRLGVGDVNQQVPEIEQLLVQAERYLKKDDAVKLISDLTFTAMISESCTLLKTFQREPDKKATDLNRLLNSHLRLDQLFSFYRYSYKLETSSIFKIMSVYKEVTGHYPDDKCISALNLSIRLAVIAKLHGLKQFEDAVRAAVSSRYVVELSEAIKGICIHLSNPVPFVCAIIQHNQFHYYRIPHKSTEFLQALIRENNDGIIFSLLKDSKLILGKDFFETLLRDSALANSLNTSNGHRLRRHIFIERDVINSLVSYDTRQIVAMLRALQVPVAISAISFSPQYQDHAEFQVKLKQLELGLTLEQLDEMARSPGFLAYLALHDAYCTIQYMRIKTHESACLALNPLRFHAFHLLKTWLHYNPGTFARLADWRVVFSFFAAIPDRDFVDKTQRILGMYPVSLEHMIRTHYSGKRLPLAFHSELRRDSFLQAVFPVIAETLLETFCNLECSITPSSVPSSSHEDQ